MTTYYNEWDSFSADWLENLIEMGQISPGIVDRRSIEDVTPNDLKGFSRAHFFAGIGVWDYALRQAGVSDDYSGIWTASCPCQPFSQAGQGAGFDDERHLWPALYHLASVRRPSVLFGEQVSSKDGLAWLDLVQTDMETAGYAFGALDLCAAGVGAPHIRQRSYWMANSLRAGRSERRTVSGIGQVTGGRQFGDLADSDGKRVDRLGLAGTGRRSEPSDRQSVERLDHHHHPGPQGYAGDDGQTARQWEGAERPVASTSLSDELAHDDDDDRCETGLTLRSVRPEYDFEHGRTTRIERAGPTNGFWRDADWLGCRDGKFRPVEPGTFPLVNGAPNRVGSLRGFGNAIVAPLAEEFIEIGMEYLEHETR